jgi:protein phosphatase
MGGHVSGEIASRLSTEQFIKVFVREEGSFLQRLEQALHAGNDAILNAVRNDKDLNGMGCTLVAGYLDQKGLRWASVGDSMLLLYRDHSLRRLNENHSLGALLDSQADANIITWEEARNSPRRHTLRSALTGAAIPIRNIEPRAFPLLPGDWILLASDGLESLSGDEIAQIVNENELGTPEQLADALLERVTGHALPNQDNTTIIVANVIDPTVLPTRLVRPPAEREMADVAPETLVQAQESELAGAEIFDQFAAAPAIQQGIDVKVIGLLFALFMIAGYVALAFFGYFDSKLTSDGTGKAKPDILLENAGKPPALDKVPNKNGSTTSVKPSDADATAPSPRVDTPAPANETKNKNGVKKPAEAKKPQAQPRPTQINPGQEPADALGPPETGLSRSAPNWNVESPAGAKAGEPHPELQSQPPAVPNASNGSDLNGDRRP